MAEKIGRNAPCPCGSGKKYKQCCLPHNEQRELDVNTKANAIRTAVAQAFEWGKRKEWLDLMEQVLAEHLSSSFEDEEEVDLDEIMDSLDPEILEIVIPFAMEDFLSSRFEPDGKNVIDDFLKRKGSTLPPFGRKYLEALRDSIPGFYEVVEVNPGISATLRDLLRGTMISVSEELWSYDLESSDIIVCRLLSFEGMTLMSTGVYDLPRKAVDILRGEIQHICREKEQEFKTVQQDPGVVLLDRLLTHLTPTMTTLWLASVIAYSSEEDEDQSPVNEEADHDHGLLLKVTWSDRQAGVRGRPYRTLLVPANASLYRLAEAITDAFEFDFDHAFGFYDNLKNPYRAREGYELFTDLGEPGRHKGVKKTPVGAVFNTMKKKMLFLFDYGDEWRFVVQLIGTEPHKGKKIAVVDSFADAPSQYGDDEDWDEE
jgi:hypothetical protein